MIISTNPEITDCCNTLSFWNCSLSFVASVLWPLPQDPVYLHLHCPLAVILELSGTYLYPAPPHPPHSSHLPPNPCVSHHECTHQPSLCQHALCPVLCPTNQILGEELQVRGGGVMGDCQWGVKTINTQILQLLQVVWHVLGFQCCWEFSRSNKSLKKDTRILQILGN